MSTQDGSGPLFSILPEEKQQHFRLLELPPELLALLTAAEPQSLIFKASENASGSGTDAEAVICTADTTYNIRQVNTSNSVYICQATEQAIDDVGDAMPQAGLQAIAQNGFTMELSKAKQTSAVPFIKVALPTYSTNGALQSRDPVSKARLFDDIPLSNAECEVGWRELACFESSEPLGCFLPSANVKLEAWESMRAQADAFGIDVTTPLSMTQIESIIEVDEDRPVELSKAVLNSISATVSSIVTIDQNQCAASLGLWQLAVLTQSNRAVTARVLVQKWKARMPEKWRNLAEMAHLPSGSYTSSEEGYLGLAETTKADGMATEGDTKKRKWHDKFRASKKAS